MHWTWGIMKSRYYMWRKNFWREGWIWKHKTTKGLELIQIMNQNLQEEFESKINRNQTVEEDLWICLFLLLLSKIELICIPCDFVFLFVMSGVLIKISLYIYIYIYIYNCLLKKRIIIVIFEAFKDNFAMCEQNKIETETKIKRMKLELEQRERQLFGQF